MENEAKNNISSQEGENLPSGSVKFSSPPPSPLQEQQNKITQPELPAQPLRYPLNPAPEPQTNFPANQASQIPPGQKSGSNKGLIIGIIIGVIVVILIIVGFLASIVLVSLNSARAKARDASIKSTLSANIPSMILYYDEHASYNGFKPSVDFNAEILACSGQPIINISPDGKNMAIFAKLCSEGSQYFCVDPVNGQEIDAKYTESGAYICDEGHLNKSTGQSINKNGTDEQINSGTSADFPSLDNDILASIVMVRGELRDYQVKNKTFKGFDKSNLDKYLMANANCNSVLKADISPDGLEYAVHRPLCSDSAKSFCAEKDSQDTHIVSTEYVERTYHCGPEVE
jgi:hypothetical protein